MTARPHLRSATLLFACLLTAACVDSSMPGDGGGGFPPPPSKPAIDVFPPEWITVPGSTLTFQAIDPVSNKPLIWSAPGELFVIDVESHAITLGSGKPKGKFQLHVTSSVDPDVVGVATIRVLPFGFSGTLSSLPGTAADKPLADVAVTRGAGPVADRRVFLALYDPVADSSEVSVWDAGFTTLLDTVSDQHFNPAQRPRVAADAHGRAFWIEQYYDPTVGDRARAIVRRNVDGSIERFEWTPAVAGGLQLMPGTDIACDDDGALYFLVRNSTSVLVVRFDDPFAAGTLPEIVGPLAATGPQVQLAIDSQGRILVAVDTLLARWTPSPLGGIEVEILADLGAAPRDLDVDGIGRVYAALATQVDVYDDAGNLVGSVTKAQVGLPTKPLFESLLGLGVDADGGLRLADDPLVDDPQLGPSSLRTYALDAKNP